LKVIYTIDNVKNVSSLFKRTKDVIIWLAGVAISFAMYAASPGLLPIMVITTKVEDWSLSPKGRQQLITWIMIPVVNADV
jgi:hypothetical protein